LYEKPNAGKLVSPIIARVSPAFVGEAKTEAERG
jgi:hypothetical protein